MRRATIVVLIGILVVGFGAYSAFWWIASGKIKLAAGDWAQAAHDKHIDASWQDIHVTGYPFSFRLELSDAVLSDKAASTPVELRAPLLSASAWPWNYHTLWLSAPGGITVIAGPDSAPVAKVAASAAEGAVALAAGNRPTVWLTLYQPRVDAATTLSARLADFWLVMPEHAPASHTDPDFAGAMLVRDLAVPIAPPEFSKTIDELGLAVTVMGDMPAAPLRQALAAWRDAGGTLELEHFDLRWGAIGATASGTLALDGDLQPIASLSGAVSGYDQLLNALVAAGKVKASDARIAKLALSMLGKPGADGRPQISTSFAIQNGEMQLGPARLGKAPHIDW